MARTSTTKKKMQVIEGLYSAAISRISVPGYALTSADREVFRSFWVLQHLRTEAASRAFAAMSDEIVDTTGAPEEFRTSIAEAVQLVMAAVPEMVSVVEDLKVCLLRNRSDVNFFTSDDPAIYTNRWYLRPGHERLGAPGLAQSGAICLLPLTPRHLFLAYDGDVYSLPATNGWVDVKSDSDVRKLNEQQLLTAMANVYFREISEAASISREYDEATARRLSSKHRINHAILDWDDGVTKRYRVTTAEEARGQDAIVHSERCTRGRVAGPTSSGCVLAPRRTPTERVLDTFAARMRTQCGRSHSERSASMRSSSERASDGIEGRT